MARLTNGGLYTKRPKMGDKLAKWKHLKDVATFNDDFQRIILDIPNIREDEQIDRYTRSLKSHTGK